MSEPCVLYTYTIQSDDPDNTRWKYAELPDRAYFSTLDEVRAEVTDLRKDRDDVFPNGAPPFQIERIETLPVTKESLLILLNKGLEPFITDYEFVEIMG
ncbi:hypothetical protein G6L63_23010 [Agrobacterium vitis]|uniref:hypothetical protein n=1 Tax=Agrobacterium vitis TaxID=373 RepID=UPI0015721309|nr:hypothetical protein [Agrobacterium vitis]NSZ50779.1 hypothetical protein [Agrobacterium vitis]UJL73854.1 hypothetical protein AVCG412_14135 [Agrobacterium vitis]